MEGLSNSGTDNSDWMARLPEKVRKEVPVLDLAIPGSHDSFTYNLTNDGRAGADQPAWLRKVSRVLPGLFSHILYRWSITQALSPSLQLQAGTRYFDIRLVAVEGTFRVLHCLMGDLISQVLDTVSLWLQAHCGEVVILDFQHLYDFTESDHRQLAQLVLSKFEGRLTSWQQDLRLLTLSSLASNGAQVIVIYPAAPQPHQFLWPRSLCLSPWPDTMSVPQLLDSLNTNLARHRAAHQPRLFVSQEEAAQCSLQYQLNS